MRINTRVPMMMMILVIMMMVNDAAAADEDDDVCSQLKLLKTKTPKQNCFRSLQKLFKVCLSSEKMKSKHIETSLNYT